jgi:hypothetical protein
MRTASARSCPAATADGLREASSTPVTLPWAAILVGWIPLNASARVRYIAMPG